MKIKGDNTRRHKNKRNVNKNNKRIIENSCQTFVCEIIFIFFSLQFTERESKRERSVVCNKCWINGKFIIMVYICCISGSRSNYTAEEANTVFSFPKDEDIRKRWIKFVNRKDWLPTLSPYIYKNHFESKYFGKGQNNKCYRLIKKLKPVRTIFNASYVTQSSWSSNLISPVSIPRKSPRKEIFQEE